MFSLVCLIYLQNEQKENLYTSFTYQASLANFIATFTVFVITTELLLYCGFHITAYSQSGNSTCYFLSSNILDSSLKKKVLQRKFFWRSQNIIKQRVMKFFFALTDTASLKIVTWNCLLAHNALIECGNDAFFNRIPPLFVFIIPQWKLQLNWWTLRKTFLMFMILFVKQMVAKWMKKFALHFFCFSLTSNCFTNSFQLVKIVFFFRLKSYI